MNDNNDPVTMEFQSQASRGSQSLQTLASGPLCSSISSLSSSSGTLPSNQDFHFYYNFDNFKHSIDEIVQTSHSLLQSVGSSATLWGSSETINFPEAIESIADDEALDWLVNVNDEILEKFNVSIDEFEKIRKKEEEMGRVGIDQDNSGFQLVCGNKKKKGDVLSESGSISDSVNGKEDASGVKVKKGALTAGTTKAKVPFHIPSIRKPQQEYNILVNNSNQYFEHVWLEISEDGQRFIHPLEKLSIMDFVDKDVEDIEPVNPPSIESTPFKLVEKVKDLKELAAKLHSVNEFAVDLEHNQYRSFQGLTCLMQISTRTEDFIIDTLKLRIHVGPYLREVFKDPTKKKVMHGAGSDVVWLQRDFGIYLCNLFDTGQASRILKLERNSLEHLLHHFCGVTAKKEYQNADWRLRPLPDEMLRYAREDTHYLLYIYDLMRIKLLSIPKEFEHSDAPLVEVYKRSAEICMQLYEKELLTESSYLHIYGLLGAGFNAKQLAIVSGLFEWRDIFARAEDESTGYVLPNKVLLEMSKQMPVTASQLRRVLKSKLPYVERNVDSLVSIIRHSMQNAAAFEADVQKLKQVRMLNASKEQGAVKEESLMIGSSTAGLVQDKKTSSFEHPLVNGASVSARETLAISGQSGEINACTFMPPSSKIATGATIQAVKKPTSGFGALLGNATSKKKSVIDKDKKESKLEQIRSSVNLSFHSFLGTREQSKTVLKEPTRVPEVSQPEEPPAVVASESTLQDIIVLEDDSEKDEDLIVLEDDSEKDESINDRPETTDSLAEGNSLAPSFKTNEENETMSPSELSTSFQQCVQSMNQNREVVKVNKSKEPRGLLQIKPFDYEAARKQVKYGEEEDSESGSKSSSAGKKKSSAVDGLQIEDGSKQFPQARRRQAFPASGNRSATFR